MNQKIRIKLKTYIIEELVSVINKSSDIASGCGQPIILTLWGRLRRTATLYNT